MNSLVLTAHDYRTSRKASIHSIASELARRGTTRFFSLRYSWLSRRTADSRLALDDRANRIEKVGGVECFLWKERLHPFNMRRRWLRPFEDLHFRLSRRRIPATLVRWIREADLIVFESGSAIAYVALARRLNPTAHFVYRGSDDLDTIQSASFLKREFAKVAELFDAICLLSPRIADGMPAIEHVYFVPNALDPSIAELADPTPYGPGIHAVSVGSMLFDPQFFLLAAPAFPAITFHLIGPGLFHRGFAPNVRVHGEMAFAETLRYIKHAQIGIAPYRGDLVRAYLADSSLKLLQYRFFGVPAVCPEAVVANSVDRHGYVPGSGESIAAAIRRALEPGQPVTQIVLSWRDAVDRLIDPASYPDTRIAR